MSEIKLKPCPFCGGEAGILIFDPRDFATRYWVECKNADCYINPGTDLYATRIMAAEAWNRRYDDEAE